MKKMLLTLAALFAAATSAFADLYVTPTGAGNKDGSDWANAFAGIQAAVDAVDAAWLANPDYAIPVIQVADGTYTRVVVTNDLALDVRSVNGAASTVIDGYGTNNCVRCYANWNYPKSPTFTGFTLRNGDARKAGNWNETDGGGAAGGTLVDCIIEDCIGYDGGGTFYSDTIRCIIRRCTASSWGGGGVEEGTHRNTLIHDCSTYVAIVYRATLYNCTVADTTAESDYYGVCYSSSIYNCVFWGNYVKGAWAEQNDEVDPKFVGDGDYRPRVGSPAIDDGDADYATEQYVGATDLAGNARVQGTAIDRGCYEGPGVEGFRVTAVADGNGSVSPTYIFTNANAVVTITADTNAYNRQVVAWTTNGVTAAWSGDTLTLAPLASDVVVTARFEVIDWYVDDATGNNSNTGDDSSVPYKTIAKAISSAAPGETIYVAPGTYSPIDTAGSRVNIVGAGGASVTIIDGGDSNRCAFLSADTTLTGFTLQHGKAISTDETNGGGGVKGGTLFDCVIKNNIGVRGGGAYGSKLVRCTVTDNNSGDGGGLFDCTAWDSFIGFNAANQGGAAHYGMLRSCTVVGNRGLIYGGVYSCTSYASIYYGNHTANRRTGYSISRGDSNCFDEEIELFDDWSFIGDPLFVDAANGDYRLRAGSRCLDNGWHGYVYDQNGNDIRGEGFARIVGAEADMGCYEGAVEGHVISVRVDGHGVVSARTLVVADGEDATVTATADGRVFQGWLVDGTDAGTSTTLVLSNVTADHVVTACFERRTTNVSDGGNALQSAIDNALDGDTLVVAPGTYSAINAVGRVLNIVSADGPAETIIKGSRGSGVLSMFYGTRAATFGVTQTRPTCTLSGFTLTGGYCAETTYGGGGVFGGIVSNCVICGNGALYTGGGANYSTLSHCVISNNTSYIFGAGASFSTLDNCLVVGNEVKFGTINSILVLAQTIGINIMIPEYIGGGAGIAYAAADHCTITRNTSSGTSAGGGFWTVLDSTYIGGNTATKDGAPQNLFDCQVPPRYICSTENDDWGDLAVGFVDSSTDDTFANAAAGDFRLKASSRCIDAGDDSSPEAADGTDFAGAPRWRAKAPDIGCYEADSIVPAAVTAVTATRSDAREDVEVAWERSRGSERYAVLRSGTNLVSEAVQIEELDNLASSFTDTNALYATKYWYWVVPKSEAAPAGGAGSSSAMGYWTTPLAITTASLPSGTSPYSKPLAATGGIAPYAWSVYDAKYQFTTNAESTFSDEGFVDVGWDYKDGDPMRNDWTTKPFPLPFAFPYFGKEYTNVWISSDGLVQFGDTHFERESFYDSPNDETGLFPFSEETFLSAPAIAVYIHDSYDSVGTIFSKDAATIVWSGQAYHWGWGSNVRFSLTLYPSGEFDFKYGGEEGYNYHAEPYARYGYSTGDGEGFLAVIGDTLAAGAPDRCIRYAPAPAWLAARTDQSAAPAPGVAAGVISATPPATTTNEIVVAVADDDGRASYRRFRLIVNSSGSLTGYAAWAALNGLGGPDEVTDGQPNLIRYAFNVPRGAFSPFTGISFNASGKPVVTLLPLVNTDGVTVKVLSTTDLTDWSNPEVRTLTISDNGTLIFDHATDPQRFYRLKAE